MSNVFFRNELEAVTTFWRIRRRDGVAIGFTSHDRDLWFDGILHRAAPGMLPSAIRRTADLQPDSAEVSGALTHDAISAADLAQGRFDAARVVMGAVDWITLDRTILYSGEIGTIVQETASFTAELHSAKSELEIDPIPRTSPTCRARFCGPGCNLNPARFTHEAVLAEVDPHENRARFIGGPEPAKFADGSVRWTGGPQAGVRMEVIEVAGTWLVLDVPIDPEITPGTHVMLREGCDHTLAMCSGRFDNSVNFRGEPFLPGNDILARYPTASS